MPFKKTFNTIASRNASHYAAFAKSRHADFMKASKIFDTGEKIIALKQFQNDNRQLLLWEQKKVQGQVSNDKGMLGVTLSSTALVFAAGLIPSPLTPFLLVGGAMTSIGAVVTSLTEAHQGHSFLKENGMKGFIEFLDLLNRKADQEIENIMVHRAGDLARSPYFGRIKLELPDLFASFNKATDQKSVFATPVKLKNATGFKR